MNILIWSGFWNLLFFLLSTGRHQKRRLQPSHHKVRRESTLTRAPTGEATRPSSPKNRKVSVVSSLRMFLWSHGI
ncbi:hypothetical protein AB205_0004880 [Aquarana catesbeiana]|uniref:Secreted protein n=1 Tax=Aquarana catesbeiana TaxID=8400 RepID=A0A2G9PDZ9_AQUCT|nr:hypothetical protein AB205_0004880 [Aquarana catesbeiana]